MSGLHMQCVYRRTRGTGTEDVAVTTHDCWSDEIENWSEADMIGMCDPIEAFWTAIKGQYHSSIRLWEIRCYEGYNGDGTPGQVDYINAVDVPGTSGAGCLPPQVACSVTEITAFRRTWGRFYLPNPSSIVIDTDGAYTNAFVDLIAGKARDMYDAWYAKGRGILPIVWSTTNYAGLPAAIDPIAVTDVRVDNVPDVQRRRRYESVTRRTSFPVPTV